MDDDQRGLLPQQLFSSGERVAQEVGEFVVRSHIGQGAMGQVFLVEHKVQGGLYALKILPLEMVSDEESLTRFAREAEALQALAEHPAIVTVYGTGRTKGGAPYYVMDYVEGRTLKRAFAEGLGREAAFDAIETVADALAFAHQRGLVHRDLKPDNVLIDERGQARLVDFGLVRAVRGSAQLTQAGQALGTPAYMAPEQTSSEEAGIGPWTDVWGLGVLSYEALTGRTPYSGASALEIYAQLYEAVPIATPRSLGAKVSPKLEAVVMRALEHAGSQRFPDAGEFLAAFRAARPPVREAVAAPKASSRAGLLVALALSSLVLLGGALFVARDQARQRREQEAALASAEEHLAGGRLDEAAAALSEAEGARGPSAERLSALRAQLSAARDERTKRSSEVEALFARGEVAAAFARWGPERAAELASPSAHWILALCGEYSLALDKCPPGTDPAERARLAAWAGDLAACEAALGAIPAASGRGAALRYELAAFLPSLGPPKQPPAREAPWFALVEAEEALGRGDVVWAAVRLGEKPGEEDLALRLAWTVASARVAVARGDRQALGVAAEACEALARAEVSPLERARALGWAAWLARGNEGAQSALRLSTYAPGLPLARTLRGEPSPWYGECGAGRRALAEGDQAAAQAAFERAGAGRFELRRSPLSAWRALAARGRAGPVGLLLARAWDRLSAANHGPQTSPRDEAQAMLGLASALAPHDPLVSWAQAELSRGRGLVDGGDAEALLRAAPADPAALLEQARSLAVQEEKRALRVLRGRIAGEQGSLESLPELEPAFRAVFAAGPVWAREAGAELLEILIQRRWLGPSGERDALQARGLALAAELLQGVELGPVLAARARLVQALRAGDAEAALSAAEELSAASRTWDPQVLPLLRLRSSLGDPQAPEAARAFLAVAGDLPAFTRLRARLARREDSSEAIPALDALQRLCPRDPELILARQLAGMDPAAPPLGGSPDSLLGLGEVLVLAPEATRLVLELLRARVGKGELKVPEFERLDVPGRPLLTNLTRALLACALLPDAAGEARLTLIVEALSAAQRALDVSPGHAGAHLLRAAALSALPTWASGRAEAELEGDLRCARAALPGAAAPLLAELSLPGLAPGRTRALFDELFAQGFLTRKSLPDALFSKVRSSPYQSLLEGVLLELRDPLARLHLRHSPAERIGLTSYELAVRAFSARLPLTSLSLRLRTGADTAFDSVGAFEGALEATIPAEQAGQRARILAEYKFWRALQVNGDPSLRSLSEEESAAQQTSRARLWLQEAGLAALQGLEDRPGGERLRLPRSALNRLGPVEALEKAASLIQAVEASQPESLELWSAWQRRWDPTATHSIFRRALAEEPQDLLSAADLERPYGRSQGLAWGAQRNCDFWAFSPLLEAGLEDELVLLTLRGAAFDTARPPDEVIYWRVRSDLRLHGEGKLPARAKLARDIYRAAQILTSRPTFFAACEGDALIDLAAYAEGEERAALAARGLEQVNKIDPSLIAPHLESEGTAWWRVVRAKALAGDAEGAKAAAAHLRKIGWGAWWGLREGIGSDPAAEALRSVFPAGEDLFRRFLGRGNDEDDDEPKDDEPKDGEPQDDPSKDDESKSDDPKNDE